MQGKKKKAKKNKKMDALVLNETTYAQGWMVDGGDDELDVDTISGLTWKRTEEAYGAEEVIKLCRSARLNQQREVDEEDFHPEPEDEPINEEEEEEIEFESHPEVVVRIGGLDEEEGEDN
ncbi:hypothetical protein GQ55_8G121200 [Panicum hallii var. hallii]|uniref:Uncharacterized protein n=1 Tax=Panicum hallii var. hallii TaxID=1504633 RepID=A0A2T7CMQ5_9POAL|nr:hypothetical protein GQ55_8G121200 [Panicum hallii var. hallii]